MKQAIAVSPTTSPLSVSEDLAALGSRDALSKSVSRLRLMLVLALLSSGAAGLAVNVGFGHARRNEEAPTLLASAGDLTSTRQPERIIVSDESDKSTGAALRFQKVDAAAPADPFEPTLPAKASVVKPALVKGADKSAAAGGPADIEKAAQAAADAAAPAADSLSLVGIIQGDPALAVVKYDGQSFFLKIGEQVADTWRLEQIGERSATFSLGKRRVEIPLHEGSSS
jgi:hypothetical protein